MELDLDIEIIISYFFFALNILRTLLYPIFAIFCRQNRKKLPPLKNKILELPALELAKRIRKQQLTSVQVLAIFIERIREVNPIINAVVDERFDEALKDAKIADQIVLGMPKSYLKKHFPLLGVPFSVKESIGVKDLQQAAGTIARANFKAKSDGAAVKVLKEAGAIPLCVTNVSEWTIGWNCSNILNGKTLNSYDLSRSAGGSSGGEGALIGAGAIPFGIGSDLFGCIRIPALFNGIFSHKPTPRHVDLNGHYPRFYDSINSYYGSIGPMCRFASDLKPLLEILCKNKACLRLDVPVPVRSIRIYYEHKFNDLQYEVIAVSRSIRKCLTEAVEYLRMRGNIVEKSNIDLSNMINIAVVLAMDPEIRETVLLTKEEKNTLLKSLFQSFFGRAKFTTFTLVIALIHSAKRFTPREKIVLYKEELTRLRKEFMEMLLHDGVFIFPTFSTPAFRHLESFLVCSAVSYSRFFNLLGFPATHVPMGLNKNGLPVGFQIVAAPKQDRLCFAIASELEKAFGGWVPPS